MSDTQSNTFSSELDLSISWDQIFSELEQEWGTRELVSLALSEANTAFVSQFTEPDGYKYMDACAHFGDFLALNIPLTYVDQKTVIQVLQVACAMHENAVNSPLLSPTSRSTHQLASTSLVTLVQKALNGPITFDDLRSDLEALNARAGEALAQAVEALDISKYLNFSPSMSEDTYFNAEAGWDATPSTQTVQTAAPVTPAPGSLVATPLAKAATEVSSTPRPATRSITKEEAAMILNNQSCRKLPTRTQSMPILLYPTSGSGPSRTPRTPFRVHPRGGNGLNSITETMVEE
ncbi:hypothetical protein BU15DRAFT_75285 [Melanogaster broomeanus]|nr:hypothetical protein BU15DRAFT_75285 [Melanogaster broomeanus]